MTDTNWGHLVRPGVYMIKKNQLIFSEVAENGSLVTNLETIHREIEVLESIVKKLEESNKEIAEYILQNQKKINGCSDSTDGNSCDDHKELLEAIKENEDIIFGKRNEIALLRKQVALQTCGKNYYDTGCLGENLRVESTISSNDIVSPSHIDL